MIDKALGFLLSELNGFLSTEFPATEPHAVLSNLALPDGSSAEAIQNKIVITIANIERDTTAIAPDFNTPPQESGRLRLSKPLNLNVYFLLSANFPQSYIEALRLLSASLAFLHLKPVFTPQSSSAFPSGMERLTVEMVSLSITELQNLWSSTGAKYLPSAYYKVRMLSITDTWVKGREPVIFGTEANT